MFFKICLSFYRKLGLLKYKIDGFKCNVMITRKAPCLRKTSPKQENISFIQIFLAFVTISFYFHLLLVRVCLPLLSLLFCFLIFFLNVSPSIRSSASFFFVCLSFSLLFPVLLLFFVLILFSVFFLLYFSSFLDLLVPSVHHHHSSLPVP